MRSHLNWWLRQVLEAFDAAKQLWLAAREQFSNGYATENGMFAEQWPAPRLRDFLVAHSYKRGAR